MFWHRRTEIKVEVEPTEGTMEKILARRLINVMPQFLVRWGANGEESWAEAEERGVKEELWRYCRAQGVGLDLRNMTLERL